MPSGKILRSLVPAISKDAVSDTGGSTQEGKEEAMREFAREELRIHCSEEWGEMMERQSQGISSVVPVCWQRGRVKATSPACGETSCTGCR